MSAGSILLIALLVAVCFALAPKRKRPEGAGVRSLPALRASSSYPREVVGEAQHQDALSSICGGRTPEGHRHECLAVLRPDQDNPHDPNAIRVEIGGRLVGYLPAADAAKFRLQAARIGLEGQPVQTGAVIRGGWQTSKRDIGSFGVNLGFVWPLRRA